MGFNSAFKGLNVCDAASQFQLSPTSRQIYLIRAVLSRRALHSAGSYSLLGTDNINLTA